MNSHQSYDDLPNAQARYLINAAAHLPGIQNNQVIDYYNKWADNYENDLDPSVYRGPQIASDMCNILLRNKDSKILDIGAGTGLVGGHLVKHGFNCIDALEPSELMLSKARSKKIYRNFFCESIGAIRKTSLKDGSYDACVISGSMGEGHVPSEGLREFARLTRQHGYVIIVMRKEYLSNVKEYSELEPLMQKLVIEKVWSKITCFDVENYSFDKTGIIYVFKKN